MSSNTAPSPVSLCPVCESYVGAYSVSVGNYQVTKCQNCGLEYTTPNPANEELNRFYGDYVDIRVSPEITALNAKRNLELLREPIASSRTKLPRIITVPTNEFLVVAGFR